MEYLVGEFSVHPEKARRFKFSLKFDVKGFWSCLFEWFSGQSPERESSWYLARTERDADLQTAIGNKTIPVIVLGPCRSTRIAIGQDAYMIIAPSGEDQLKEVVWSDDYKRTASFPPPRIDHDKSSPSSFGKVHEQPIETADKLREHFDKLFGEIIGFSPNWQTPEIELAVMQAQIDHYRVWFEVDSQDERKADAPRIELVEKSLTAKELEIKRAISDIHEIRKLETEKGQLNAQYPNPVNRSPEVSKRLREIDARLNFLKGGPTKPPKEY